MVKMKKRRKASNEMAFDVDQHVRQRRKSGSVKRNTATAGDTSNDGETKPSLSPRSIAPSKHRKVSSLSLSSWWRLILTSPAKLAAGLENVFYHLGFHIARHPYAVILGSIIAVGLASLGTALLSFFHPSITFFALLYFLSLTKTTTTTTTIFFLCHLN